MKPLFHVTPARRAASSQRLQTGFTLVELMVALALGLLVAGAGIAALIVGRQGFSSVDTSTQLRENARFAASLIERIAIQSAYHDQVDGPVLAQGVAAPGLQGFNNAIIVNPTALPATFPLGALGLAQGSRPANCPGVTDTSCLNGSDILMIRYWGVSNPPGAGNPADGSMINCSGQAEPERATGPSLSVFHVARGASGEPSLVCTYLDTVTGLWTTVPLVEGVEGFQVLYGVDRFVTPGGPAAAAASDALPPSQFLHADQLDAGSPPAYSPNNWTHVRSLRIGLLVRGAANAAADRAATAATWPVLSASGPLFASAYPFVPQNGSDPGSSLTIATADGRVRQQMVFSIHLRNQQFQQ